MTNILSKEERTSIVNSHKRNLAMNQYNIQLSIIEEQAKTSPDSSTISDLNAQKNGIDRQLAALDTELESISEESDPSK